MGGILWQPSTSVSERHESFFRITAASSADVLRWKVGGIALSARIGGYEPCRSWRIAFTVEGMSAMRFGS